MDGMFAVTRVRKGMSAGTRVMDVLAGSELIRDTVVRFSPLLF